MYVRMTRTPAIAGPLDRRLGTSLKNTTCATCNQKLRDCAGHFGVINLALPVFHIGFFNATRSIVEKICKCCSRVLLKDEAQRAEFISRLNSPLLGGRQRLLAEVAVEARKKKYCSACGAYNGLVKKVGVLKLTHEKYVDRSNLTAASLAAAAAASTATPSVTEARRRAPVAVDVRAEFKNALDTSPELASLLSKVGEDLTPLRVHALLSALSDDDCALLGLDASTSRPEALVMTRLLVPPVCLRPTVTLEASHGTTEDDLTIQLSKIVQMNKEIRNTIEKGRSMQEVMEQWQYLQILTATYINNDLPGVPSMFAPKKPQRSLCQRLKGKGGRFRGNLSGKRVDFSSRTVISPDPNLRVDEVRALCIVCVHTQYMLTHVTRSRRSRCQQLLQ
jgi:DNA-directed RNA polymerase III subunit RPC1